jgi:hypothetical protein
MLYNSKKYIFRGYYEHIRKVLQERFVNKKVAADRKYAV